MVRAPRRHTWSVTVPAGTFEVLRVAQSGDGWQTDYFVNEEVGTVWVPDDHEELVSIVH